MAIAAASKGKSRLSRHIIQQKATEICLTNDFKLASTLLQCDDVHCDLHMGLVSEASASSSTTRRSEGPGNVDVLSSIGVGSPACNPKSPGSGQDTQVELGTEVSCGTDDRLSPCDTGQERASNQHKDETTSSTAVPRTTAASGLLIALENCVELLRKFNDALNKSPGSLSAQVTEDVKSKGLSPGLSKAADEYVQTANRHNELMRSMVLMPTSRRADFGEE
ncbi:hypothetical protein DFJ77DRAFT_453135 [Powellomyces hirtus]|nr:hypothetical protein DFJ77DRAFT_453135 [Powellomyces hirtus]